MNRIPVVKWTWHCLIFTVSSHILMITNGTMCVCFHGDFKRSNLKCPPRGSLICDCSEALQHCFLMSMSAPGWITCLSTHVLRWHSLARGRRKCAWRWRPRAPGGRRLPGGHLWGKAWACSGNRRRRKRRPGAGNRRCRRWWRWGWCGRADRHHRRRNRRGG